MRKGRWVPELRVGGGETSAPHTAEKLNVLGAVLVLEVRQFVTKSLLLLREEGCWFLRSLKEARGARMDFDLQARDAGGVLVEGVEGLG